MEVCGLLPSCTQRATDCAAIVKIKKQNFNIAGEKKAYTLHKVNKECHTWCYLVKSERENGNLPTCIQPLNVKKLNFKQSVESNKIKIEYKVN